MTPASLQVVRARRAVTAAALLAAAWWLWVDQHGFRGGEAAVAASASHLLTGTRTFVSYANTTFFLGVGSPTVFGLTVTTECTAVFVIAVVAGTGALLAAFTRVRLDRILFATVAAAALFGAVNLARLVIVAMAAHTWGFGAGFHYVHGWAGTFITLAGLALTCACYLYVLGFRPRRRPAGAHERGAD